MSKIEQEGSKNVPALTISEKYRRRESRFVKNQVGNNTSRADAAQVGWLDQPAQYPPGYAPPYPSMRPKPPYDHARSISDGCSRGEGSVKMRAFYYIFAKCSIGEACFRKKSRKIWIFRGKLGEA